MPRVLLLLLLSGGGLGAMGRHEGCARPPLLALLVKRTGMGWSTRVLLSWGVWVLVWLRTRTHAHIVAAMFAAVGEARLVRGRRRVGRVACVPLLHLLLRRRGISPMMRRCRE